MNKELPSRFQIGEKVSVYGRPGTIVGVSFTIDKVAYAVEDNKGNMHSPVLSEFVNPIEQSFRVI